MTITDLNDIFQITFYNSSDSPEVLVILKNSSPNRLSADFSKLSADSGPTANQQATDKSIRPYNGKIISLVEQSTNRCSSKLPNFCMWPGNVAPMFYLLLCASFCDKNRNLAHTYSCIICFKLFHFTIFPVQEPIHTNWAPFLITISKWGN